MPHPQWSLMSPWPPKPQNPLVSPRVPEPKGTGTHNATGVGTAPAPPDVPFPAPRVPGGDRWQQQEEEGGTSGHPWHCPQAPLCDHVRVVASPALSWLTRGCPHGRVCPGAGSSLEQQEHGKMPFHDFWDKFNPFSAASDGGIKPPHLTLLFPDHGMAARSGDNQEKKLHKKRRLVLPSPLEELF